MSQENLYHYNDIITMYYYNVKSCAEVGLSMKAGQSSLLPEAVPQLHIHNNEHYHHEKSHLLHILYAHAYNQYEKKIWLKYLHI